MFELRGNLFIPSTYKTVEGKPAGTRVPDAICITTNGFVKKNGEAVMGRGCAKRAAQLMPGLPESLGQAINAGGNRVYTFGVWEHMEIVTFPVKPVGDSAWEDRTNIVKHMRSKFNPGQRVPGWACVANSSFIQRSAYQLKDAADNLNWTFVVLPRPGCGAGELEWSKVKPILEGILDNRFACITF